MSQCSACNSYCAPTICCKKCKVFWLCDSLCEFCPKGIAHVRHCKTANSNNRPPLRLKLNDRVLVSTGIDTWEEGIVTVLWPSDEFVYRTRIVSSDEVINVKRDTNADIHFIDFDISDSESLLFHHVKCGSSMVVIMTLFAQIYKTQILEKLLSHHDKMFYFAIRHGNYSVISFLVSEIGYDPYTVDDKGRNVLQLATVHKMATLVFNLVKGFNKRIDCKTLFSHTDNDGRNSLHYAVLFYDGVIDLDEYFVKRLNGIPGGNLIYGMSDAKGLTALDYAGMTRKQYPFYALKGPTLAEKVRMFEIAVADQRKFTDEAFYLDLIKQHFTVKGLNLDNCHLNLAPKQLDQLCFIALHCVSYGFVDCLRWLCDESGWNLDAQPYEDHNVFKKCSVYHSEGSGYEKFIEIYHCKCDNNRYNEEFDNRKSRAMQSLFGDLCAAHDQSDFSGEGLVTLLDRLADHSRPITMDNIIAPIRPTYDISALQSKLLAPLSTDTVYWFQMYLFELHHKLSGTFLLEKRIEVLKFLFSKGRNEDIVFLSKFASCGQVQIIDWFVSEYSVDLRAPLENNSTLSFEGATTAHYLCLMASMGGHVHLLAYLLPFVDNDYRFRASDQPYNLMDVSVLGGYVPVFKWLVQHKLYDVEPLPDMFYDLVRPNTPCRNVHVAAHILELLGNKVLFALDESLMPLYYSSDTGSLLLDALWFKAARVIQTSYRWHLQWRQYRHYFGHNLTLYLQFKRQWSGVVSALEACAAQKTRLGAQSSFSWLVLKKQFDMVYSRLTSSGEEDNIATLTAMAVTMQLSDSADGETQFSSEVVVLDQTTPSSAQNESTTSVVGLDSEVRVAERPLHNIELSQHVLKWLHSADSRYRAMFHKKVTLLADGYRSYALSKPLQGCRYPIYESKLDDGQRILWTKLQRDTAAQSIMVWFVSKHDKVPHYLSLIDNAAQRLAKMFTVVDVTKYNGSDGEGPLLESERSLQMGEEDVLLDPTGNCPLKVYQTNRHELQNCIGSTADGADVAMWAPPLRLSSKQRNVNDESGSVLLLGRSGTGKTICLCDRMTSDRNSSVAPIQQLFVCRSKRLCEFVKSYQEQLCDAEGLRNTTFLTLSAFTTLISDAIHSDYGAASVSFPQSCCVDYHRFADIIYPSIQRKCGVAASVVWLHTRSFLKGSVEAVMQGRALTLEQYLDLSVFGVDRCRLSVEDRREVYAVFVRYEDSMKTQGLWDDADYTLDLLNRSKLQPLSTQYDKVYVDEVQDNTQAEIVLFFLAAGMNTQSLFLAGDPAQSVVQGVDFRFEDVRSIVYKLSGGKQSIHRPMKLTVNYRSHSGVLNCAAAVLDKMFAMFPGAANVLPKDVGLFQGPRPACCQVNGMNGLANLLLHNQRLIVLCVDEEVEAMESALSQQGVINVVLGIRAAKGLEFTDVVLVDFFRSLPARDHSVWKGLFSDNTPTTAEATHPHVEGQLKLLYTAVTRSCNRLLFVETVTTPLSSSVFRWLVSSAVAEMHVTNIDHAELMTSDEWRAQGIEFALSAEGSESVSMLQRAERCFSLANDSTLVNFTQVQLSIANCLSSMITPNTCKNDISEEVKLSEAEVRKAVDVLMGGVKCAMFPECAELCALLQCKVEYNIILEFEVTDRLKKLAQ